MKLTIRRDQAAKKGILGGHKGMRFSLACRVVLDPKEQELIDKYKAYDQVLAILEGRREPVVVSIRSLVQGYTEEHDDVVSLLKNEDEIKNACNNFKNLLLVMSSFGGEEIIEI